MRILLTNDDGISSPALEMMRERLENRGHEVFIVAPKENKSAVSMAISLHDGVKVKKLDEKTYWVDGTPCDCIHFCIEKLFKNESLDLVISGINMGSNLGYETLYSGTVAAARLAHMKGIKSMASSYDQMHPSTEELELCADYTIEFAQNYLEENHDGYFVNYNMPSPIKENLDWVETKVGNRSYDNQLNQVACEEDGIKHYYYEGILKDDSEDEHHDSVAIRNGKISITKLKAI
ncbi:MAG: 5'/3'-nucleotidase SurE [Tissierellales bacterium]|jgi:5'-nucleotidase|nr:5'/3'-nucleotidase SurE [Tissierellales bacterium]